MKKSTHLFTIYSSLVLFIVLLCSASLSAQVEVYRTYEDYQNGVAENYESYRGYMHKGGKASLFFYKDDKKTTVKCKEMWGFKYKDVLFRSEIKSGHPVRVMISGDIVYYENGFAHLEMLGFNKKKGTYDLGTYCYLSKDLTSEIIPMYDYQKSIKEFKAQYPEFKTLYDCIEKDYEVDKLKICIQEFEANKE